MTRPTHARLARHAHEKGAALFGVARLAPDEPAPYPELEALPNYACAISVGVPLSTAVLDTVTDHPSKVYFHHYRQVNALLDQIALSLALVIQETGGRALPIAASQIVDWPRQRAHLSHKHIAQRAGLGWLGRSNLLVNPTYGAGIRLVTVLTDLELEPDSPLLHGCGSCLACLEACPAHAIKRERKDFDHIACFEKLKSFVRAGYVGQYVCGVCVRVCARAQGKGS